MIQIRVNRCADDMLETFQTAKGGNGHDVATLARDIDVPYCTTNCEFKDEFINL